MRATTLGRLARHTLETRQPPTRLLSTTTFFNKNNSKSLGLTLRREHRRRRQRQRQTFDISNSDNTGPSYRLRAASTSSSDARPDGIVVLAGGLTSEGSLPKWVVGRLDAAVALHEQNPGSKILCTGGGTPHKPPILFDNGHVNHESTVSILSFCHARTHREEAFEKLKSDFFLLLLPPPPFLSQVCAKYLIERGVSPQSIVKETSSYDTIGNAYFSLVIHALPLRWKRVVAITSEFHMPRSKAAFRWIYGAADPRGNIDLDFLSVPDQGIEGEALRARIERELESAAALEENAKTLTTLSQINQWLHETHRCYAVSRQEEWKSPTEADDLALKSY